jgi:hypothetical protein
MAYIFITELRKKNKRSRKYDTIKYMDGKSLSHLKDNKYIFKIGYQDGFRTINQTTLELTNEQVEEIYKITNCKFNLNYQPIVKVIGALKELRLIK